MQALDAPLQDDPEEVRRELSAKRLGTSHTVSKQIARYRARAREGGRVEVDEVASLLGLCSRRVDARLLYSNAGRLAARYAASRAHASRGARHVLPGFVGHRVGTRAVGRLGGAVLGLDVTRSGEGLLATPAFARAADPWAGAPCVFFGSALGALLGVFTDFDGAVLHERCAANGADVCVWSTDSLGED